MIRLDAPWLRDPACQQVMSAIGEGYYVGGCVRNALLGLPASDIDIATPLPPVESQGRLERAGLKVLPTGISHGTVTAVIDGTAIEVTTFRADIATDGRHAEVAFTSDLATDAARRDFTMNALYADAAGQVIDPLDGLPDLEGGLVRFIGDPCDRIREDYLRILRFFRFHAWYGAPGIDAEGLAACAELAEGLDQLARERIGWEFRKLFGAQDPAPAVASMEAAGVLARCLPGAVSSFVAPLVHAEQVANCAPNWKVRLKVVGGEDVVARLRLSRAEGAALARLDAALEAGLPVAATSWKFGSDIAEGHALIVAASTGALPPAQLSTEVKRGQDADFPLKSGDLIAAGVPPGPEIGAALARAEAYWLAEDFRPDLAALLERALR